MEIQKVHSAISTDIGTRSQSKSPSQTETAKPASIVSTSPVSDDWQLLARVQSELQQLTDVDQAKVDEIRNSLQAGTFELDIDAIGDAVFKQHT